MTSRRRKASLALVAFISAIAAVVIGGMPSFAAFPDGPPETTISSGPSTPTQATGATFHFSSDDPSASFECTLDGAAAPCTSPESYSGLSDGSHNFSVAATGLTGTDPTPDTRSWEVDATSPNTTITAKPASLTNSTSASFSFSSQAGSTFECQIDGGNFEGCISGVDYNSLGEGPHSFAVQATDPAGNTETSPATHVWTVDTTPPNTSITDSPPALTSSTSASFSYSSTESGSTFECKLDSGSFQSCSSSGRTYSGLSDGPHDFFVRATDPADNPDSSEASYSWTVLSAEPSTTITGGPSGATNDDTPTFTFTSNDSSAGFECKLDGPGGATGTFGACFSPEQYAPLSDGSYTFNVRAKNSVGTVDPTPDSQTFRVDTAAPETSIGTKPASLSNSSTATFSFSSSEAAGSTFECTLDGTAASCTSPKTYNNLDDGPHTFAVRATDSAGNADPSEASHGWTVMTAEPGTTITGGPSGATNNNNPSFSFDSDDPNASFECRLQTPAGAGTYQACTSGIQYGPLGDAQYTFFVRAKNAVGNTDASPASRGFTVDTHAPTTTINNPKPPALSGSRSATLNFGSSPAEANLTFKCRLDGGSLEDCTSPKTYTGLGDGPHEFGVVATDEAGNTDPSEATHSWSVLGSEPNTSISTGPSGPTTDNTPSFTFDSNDPNATFECRLDGPGATTGSFASCTNPKNYNTALSDGSYTFLVRAKNAVGTVDSSPSSQSFQVDTTAPTATIGSGPPALTNSTSATFGFSSNDGSAQFECRLDPDELDFTPCSSPRGYSALLDGLHTFRVRAVDPLGNVGATASRSFTVDTTPPDTTITSGPASTTPDETPTFTFSSTGGSTSFECWVDLQPANPQTCMSPHTTPPLTDGLHTFYVRARDAATNVDASPASQSFTVDTVAPNTFIDSGPLGPTQNGNPEFSFSSDEAGSTFQCSLDGGSFAACTSPKGYANLSEGAHTFAVRALDRENHIDQTPATRSFTVDKTAPNTTITAGPSQSTPTKLTSASFTFNSNEPATLQCSLDNAQFADCLSPKSYVGLLDGVHAFRVRSIDTAGNFEVTVASWSWTVDTTPPDTLINSSVGTTTNINRPSFSITSNEVNATFTCQLTRLDGPGGTNTCTGGNWTPSTPLPDGLYRLTATAKDVALNTDPTPATRDFTVDTFAPTTKIDVTPTTVNGVTNETTANFSFSSNESGGTFECKLDSAPFSTCTSPAVYTDLKDGSHTFSVRAKDLAGNPDPSNANFTWTVNTSIPQTSIIAGPPPVTNNTTATLRFSSNLSSATFECRLDGGAFVACTTPAVYTNLAPGQHSFEVAAIVGKNRDTEPEKRTWTVDLTPPDTSIASGPSGEVASSFATFTFGSEPGASFECKLDGGNWHNCSSPRVYGDLAIGNHSVQVRAVDGPGNADPSPAARSWKVVAAKVQASGSRLISPFPVIRIAGTIKATGVKLKLLAINATSGTKITIRCHGKSCPFKRTSRKASLDRTLAQAAKVLRIRSLQGRFLRAGTRIEIFVTKKGLIGKYTRFKIRRGKAPKRTDGCLMPGSKKPVRCPPA